MKHHPLHTKEFIQAFQQDPINSLQRRTGRTTAHCLKVIAEAMLKPGERVYFKDHHGTIEATRNMRNVLDRMIYDLKLQHLYIKFENHSRMFYLIFKNEEQDYE